MRKYIYSAGGYPELQRMEFVKETEKFVTVKVKTWNGFEERRFLKRSSTLNFFDTFEQAKAFLIAQLDTMLSAYQSSINSVMSKKEKYNELTENKLFDMNDNDK